MILSIIFDLTPMLKRNRFGPCTSEIPVSDADEAPQVANSSVFELSTSIFGDDTSKPLLWRRRFNLAQSTSILDDEAPVHMEDPKNVVGVLLAARGDCRSSCKQRRSCFTG